jgi:Tfp pilus assembly protein PilP
MKFFHFKYGVLFCFFMQRCSDEPVYLPQNTVAVAKNTSLKQQTTSFVEKDFRYTAKDKRDPFEPFIPSLSENEASFFTQDENENIYKYEVSQYRLTAVLMGAQEQYALLEDPSGVSHIVFVGQKVGKTGGKVVRIYKEGLQVLETYDDAFGKKVMVPIEIALPRNDLKALKSR